MCLKMVFVKDVFPINQPSRLRKNQMANFGNVQNLPFAFFSEPPNAESSLLIHLHDIFTQIIQSERQSIVVYPIGSVG